MRRAGEAPFAVFLVLAHDRRRIVHFNVTAHPTAEWTAQQLREVLNDASLHRHVRCFLAYYHESRTHLSLAKNAPEPRPV
jgi:hypothetical protein